MVMPDSNAVDFVFALQVDGDVLEQGASST